MAESMNATSQHRKSQIGPATNRWLHSTRKGFDLTRSSRGPKITIETTSTPITISPSLSALVIIDMQNFFLSPAFGRSKESAGHSALKQLVDHAVPAARKAGIRIIWVNWGLTEEEVKTMPPAVTRAFGFEAVDEDSSFGDGWTESENGVGVDKFGEVRSEAKHGKARKASRGLGSQCGEVTLENGEKVDGGRLLMRDTWNAALYPPLDTVYEEGSKLNRTPDVWIHKNRMSGIWGGRTDLEDFLEAEGIRTLFFTGVNTDQCVGGTLMDAFSKGYDCVLLADGCGTSSPEFAQQAFQFNAARTFGFCTTCGDFAKGADAME
ncbi:Isochorismatase hydrolase [Aaosphaeria arxii CBS 175.79]|uniref:Isochorismatase hydrolase n=1 Tax=Aaosphaeria arxii CBS 175.79 TaxID=1450172 RepID=A0A6A5XQM0_9PLEO|nr:Isochorismatase hydrolase [Aaosphaeria arxii CBS 175.79]KAF2015462.1 Isochorismatase hydrolase [Aaosphaeria arxii CBS 175.79]